MAQPGAPTCCRCPLVNQPTDYQASLRRSAKAACAGVASAGTPCAQRCGNRLRQLTVDAGRAPSKVFRRHPADQVADLLGCWRATWALRLPTPSESHLQKILCALRSWSRWGLEGRSTTSCGRRARSSRARSLRLRTREHREPRIARATKKRRAGTASAQDLPARPPKSLKTRRYACCRRYAGLQRVALKSLCAWRLSFEVTSAHVGRPSAFDLAVGIMDSATVTGATSVRRASIQPMRRKEGKR